MANDEERNGETVNVYGAIEDDLELQNLTNITNPYYDGGVDMFSENRRGQGTNPTAENEEIVSATSNIYYGLW